MKLNNITIIAIGLFLSAFLFSCQDQILDNIVVDDKPQQEQELSTYTIPLELALEEFFETFDMLLASLPPSDMGLRSGNANKSARERSINVTTVYSERANSLRSSDTISGSPFAVNELLYVVNFADNGGFGVLAADVRIPDLVIAIATDGFFDPKDFFRPIIFCPDDELEGFEFFCSIHNDWYIAGTATVATPASMILQFATNAVTVDSLGDGCGCGIDIGCGCSDGSGNDSGGNNPSPNNNNNNNNNNNPLPPPGINWRVAEQIGPLLPSNTVALWGQRRSYNYFYPVKGVFNRRNAPVGCVTLAVAQILAHHEFPRNRSWNGRTASWNSIRFYRCIIWNPHNLCGLRPATETGLTVSSMFFEISKGVSSRYWKNWTFARPGAARNYLASLGYRNVVRHYGYNTDRVVRMIRNDNPVFIAAMPSVRNLFKGGHAWVIDGIKIRERMRNGNVERQTLVHCVWGWEGTSNGWFASGVFDLRAGPEIPTTEQDANIRPNFNWAFHIITYDNPN